MGCAFGGRVASASLVGKFGSVSFFPLLCCGVVGFLLCGLWPTSLPALFLGLALTQACTLLPVLNLLVCSYLNHDLEKSEANNRWVNFLFFLGVSFAVLAGGVLQDQFGWEAVTYVGAACTSSYTLLTACDPWIRVATCSGGGGSSGTAPPHICSSTATDSATSGGGRGGKGGGGGGVILSPAPSRLRRRRRASVRGTGTRLPWSALLIAVSLMISCLLYGIVVTAGLWRTATAFRFSAGLNGALLAGGDALPSVLLALMAMAKPLLLRLWRCLPSPPLFLRQVLRSSGQSSAWWRRATTALTQRPFTLLLPLVVQGGAVALLATPYPMIAAAGIVVSETHHCVLMSSHKEAFLSLCDRERIASQLSLLTVGSKVMYSVGGFLGPPLTLLSPLAPFFFALCLAVGWAATAAALFALRTHQLLRRARRRRCLDTVPTPLASSASASASASRPPCSPKSPSFAPATAPPRGGRSKGEEVEGGQLVGEGRDIITLELGGMKPRRPATRTRFLRASRQMCSASSGGEGDERQGEGSVW